MKDQQTISSWMTTAELPSRSPLQDNIEVDVCIVGAGIAGMTTAYLLTTEGLSVAVLDDGPVGGGMTGRTTAHLVNALDDPSISIGYEQGESSMSTNSNVLPRNEVNETPEKQINIGEIERLASGIAGGALTIFGLRRRSIAGLGLTLAGTVLLHRGVSGHCNVYKLAGIGTHSVTDEAPVAKDVHVEKSIVINKSPEELYRFWREFENLPRFMKHLESVTCAGLNRSHWIAKGPAGKNVQWDAEIYNDKPGEMIAWRSLEGSEIVNAGSVRFTALGERGTEVKVVLNYNVPGGKVSALIAKLLGREPGQMISDDLRRLKQILETGEKATTEGQPSARDPEAAPYKAVGENPRETPTNQPAKGRAALGGA